MIDFACRCGRYTFSVPMEMAGDMLQCPECRRLVNVPLLSELSSLDTQGGFKLGDQVAPPMDDPVNLDKKLRAFTRDRFDADGNPIDMRPTFDDVLAAHDSPHPPTARAHLGPHFEADGSPSLQDIPFAEIGAPETDHPKYDPETGELVQPLEIKLDPVGQVRPHPLLAPKTPPIVSYAGKVETAPVRLSAVPMQLLRPANLLVMFIILLAHIIVLPINVLLAAGIFVAPLSVICAMFFMSHYGNVVEESGPADQDELPRPMRDFEFSGDIWQPFTHVAGAFLLCYTLPLIAYLNHLPMTGVLLLAAGGTWFFPAVLLTLCTSGSSINLRPDRLLGVIRIIGPAYLILVATFVIASGTYYLGLWRMQIDLLSMFNRPSVIKLFAGQSPAWFNSWITYPMLLIGIYLAHAFCFSLGMVYRLKQPEFPWVLQRHIPTKLAERNRPSRQRDLNANSATVKAKLAAPVVPPKPPR